MSDPKIKRGRKVATRARIWCFTLNNPDEKEESQLSHENFLSGCKQLIWQVEEGEKKTPHIQGVVQMKNQVTFETMKKKLPGAHLEVCKNFNASKHYCQKDDGRIRGPFLYPGKRKNLTSRQIANLMKEENPFGFVLKEKHTYECEEV